jgi:hypothetical protein
MRTQQRALPSAMRKGLRFLVVLGFVAAVPPLGPSGKPPWWGMRLALTVRGTYVVKDAESAFTGDFTFKTLWEGTMERDGEDFLVYHAKTDVQEWTIREKATLPGSSRVLTEKDVSEGPKLQMNYILRQGDDVRFDFEVKGFQVPLGPSPEKFELGLPSSREDSEEGADYAASIAKGTNRIQIAEDGLEKASLEKSFAWDWKRQQWAVRGNGAVQVGGSHKVTVVITIARH